MSRRRSGSMAGSTSRRRTRSWSPTTSPRSAGRPPGRRPGGAGPRLPDRRAAAQRHAALLPRHLWLDPLSQGRIQGGAGAPDPAAEALPKNPWVQYHVGMTQAALKNAHRGPRPPGAAHWSWAARTFPRPRRSARPWPGWNTPPTRGGIRGGDWYPQPNSRKSESGCRRSHNANTDPPAAARPLR